MLIEDAHFSNNEGTLISARIDGLRMYVPVDEENRHYQEIQEQNIVVGPYVPPGDNYLESRNGPRGYAKIGDQLDMLYWDKVNGTNTWVEHVAEVKNRFPKDPSDEFHELAGKSAGQGE